MSRESGTVPSMVLAVAEGGGLKVAWGLGQGQEGVC